MRLVVETLIRSLPTLAEVVAFGAFMFAIFGILGVQLFAGRFSICNQVRAACVLAAWPGVPSEGNECSPQYAKPRWGVAYILLHGRTYPPPPARAPHQPRAHLPGAALPGPALPCPSQVVINGTLVSSRSECVEGVEFTCSEDDVCDDGPGSTAARWWGPPMRNFDHLGRALLTLFTVVTLDGFMEVAWSCMDAVGYDEVPQLNAAPWMGLYVIAFVFLGSFFWVNVLVSVIIDHYTRLVEEEGDLLVTKQVGPRKGQAGGGRGHVGCRHDVARRAGERCPSVRPECSPALPLAPPVTFTSTVLSSTRNTRTSDHPQAKEYMKIFKFERVGKDVWKGGCPPDSGWLRRCAWAVSVDPARARFVPHPKPSPAHAPPAHLSHSSPPHSLNLSTPFTSTPHNSSPPTRPAAHPPFFAPLFSTPRSQTGSHRWFDQMVLATICINIAAMAAVYDGSSRDYDVALGMVNVACTLIFAVEAAVKITALGWPKYWRVRAEAGEGEGWGKEACGLRCCC